MLMLGYVLSFTILDKCFCDGVFSSDNVTSIFLG